MRTIAFYVFAFIVAWLAVFGAAVLLLLAWDWINPIVPIINKGAFR